jgi:hypothetical protein
MPLKAFTDEQLGDLQYSARAGLSPQQQEAVDEELHERAVSAADGQHPEAEALAQPVSQDAAGIVGAPSPYVQDHVREHANSEDLREDGSQQASDLFEAQERPENFPDLVAEPAPVPEELDPALFDASAPGETIDPALFDPAAPGATVDPSLLDPTAPGETIDPALLDPAAPGETIDPALLEQDILEPSGVADPYLATPYPTDPIPEELYTADQDVQDQGFDDF